MSRLYGLTPSKLDGTEKQFKTVSWDIPEEYDYRDVLPEVWNQGATNMCVTYSISAHLDWNYNVDNKIDNTSDNNIDRNEIYSIRSTAGDNGMTFKEALTFLKNKGTHSSKGLIKIEDYAMIGSEMALKQALLLNGPCIAGLPVYNTNIDEFWKVSGKLNGGHAVSIVGYNKDGFIIRNSWGIDYGKNGYALLSYSDFGSILECWTIID